MEVDIDTDFDMVKDSYYDMIDNMGCHGINCKWFTEVCPPCERCHLLLLKLNVPHRWVEPLPVVDPPCIGGELHPDIPIHSSVYHLTLTSNVDDPYEIRNTFHKFIKSAQVEAVYWIAALELTKAGLPHIHVVIYSARKYVDVKKISQAKYFRGRFQLNTVRNLDNYLLYINKNFRSLITEEYCARKGVPQFWSIKDVAESNVSVEDFDIQQEAKITPKKVPRTNSKKA